MITWVLRAGHVATSHLEVCACQVPLLLINIIVVADVGVVLPFSQLPLSYCVATADPMNHPPQPVDNVNTVT